MGLKRGKKESSQPDISRLSDEQVLQLAARLSGLLQEKKQVVPVSIFASELSPAEALVKHLKEHEHLRHADIARLLNRDQRGIWCTYQRAQRKVPEKLALTPSPYVVPVEIFSERKLSILEHVVHHLRSQNVQIKTIASLINKRPGTIASVHHRVRRKLQ